MPSNVTLPGCALPWPHTRNPWFYSRVPGDSPGVWAANPDVQPMVGEGTLSHCQLIRTPFTPSVCLAVLTRLYTIQGRFGVSFTFESHADFGAGNELGGIKYKTFIFQGKQTKKSFNDVLVVTQPIRSGTAWPQVSRLLEAAIHLEPPGTVCREGLGLPEQVHLCSAPSNDFA